MKKLRKRLLVFLLTMAMCCPLLLEPLSVLADGNDNHLEGWAVESDVRVPYGEDAELEVGYSADDTTGMTFEWVKVAYKVDQNGNEQRADIDLEDATTGKLTVHNVTEASKYECTVRDKNGDGVCVLFSVGVENHFEAEAAEPDIWVPYGEDAELEVSYSADDTTGMTFQWFQVIYEENEDGDEESHDLALEGATTDKLTVHNITEACEYKCRVCDRFGENIWVLFTVGIDNHFGAWAAMSDVRVAYGEDAEMEVKYSADDTTGMTFEWVKVAYKVDQNGNEQRADIDLEDATTGKLTVHNVTEASKYECTVRDKNGDGVCVLFSVGVENHFEAEAAEPDIWVPYGEDAELEVSYSADDTTGMTFQWFKVIYEIDEDGDEVSHKSEVEGATTDKLTIHNVTEACEYECRVWDKYGDSIWASFYIAIENHLTVTAETTEYYVNSGGSVELSVDVSADDVTQLTYQWYERAWFINEDGEDDWNDEAISGATSITYQLENVTETKIYVCYVTDQYGNYDFCNDIRVSVSNRLQARSLTTQAEYRLGDRAVLMVDVSAEDMTGITYQWYKYREEFAENGFENKMVLLEEDGTFTFTTDMIEESWNYLCKVIDQYGNICEVSVPVYVGNGMRISKVSEDEVQLTSEGTVKLEMKARTNDHGSITYYWCKYGDESNDYEDDMLSVGSRNFVIVDRCGDYKCYAVDEYGRVMTSDFTVISATQAEEEADFDAWAVGDNKVVIPTDGSATLKVATNSSPSETVTYEWVYYKSSFDEFGLPSEEECVDLDCNESSLVVADNMNEGTYECWVTNDEGIEIDVEFEVYFGQKKELKLSSSNGTIDTDEYNNTLWLAYGETATITASVSGLGSGVSYYWVEDAKGGDYYSEWHMAESSNSITVTAIYDGLSHWYVCYAMDAQGHYITKFIDIMVRSDCTVTFQANGGSGSMDKDAAQKYYEYELPECEFTAPEGKVFAGWDVNGELYEEGETIIPGGDVTVKATWKNAPIAATFNHTCSFQNKIEVNFKVTANIDDYDEFWLSIDRQVFSGAGAEHTWKTVKISKYSVDSSGRYVFTYDDIAAAEMGDLLLAKLCARKGDEAFESAVDEYSVKKYAVNKLGGENASTNKKFRKLIVDTLNYGAAAQVYFKRNTGNLVNNILKDEWKEEGSQKNPTLTPVNNVTTNGGMTAVLKNKSVTFNSGVELNLYTTYGGSVPGPNVKVVVSYVNTLGNAVTESVTSDKFMESPKDGVMRYRAVFTSIATPDFGQPLTIKIYDGSTQISETYTYSIGTYAFNRLKDSTDDNFKALLKAMMNYSLSAKDYFTPTE